MIPAKKKQQQQKPIAETTTAPEKIVVAVKAGKAISKAALKWALSHVVRPGDCVTFLAVISDERSGRRLWRFPKVRGACKSSGGFGVSSDRLIQISEACAQMVLELNVQIEVKMRIKVVTSMPDGAVVAEAKSKAANWVVLDKKLKQEQKQCMEELHCNIVEMKGSQAKVLRLNLACYEACKTPFLSDIASPPSSSDEMLRDQSIKYSTPVSSPEQLSFCSRLSGTKSLLTTNDTADSLFLVYKNNPLFEDTGERMCSPTDRGIESNETLNCSTIPGHKKSALWSPLKHDDYKKTATGGGKSPKTKSLTSKTLLEKFVQHDQDVKAQKLGGNNRQAEHSITCMKNDFSLRRHTSMPPPLCSLCQHKAPVFGKPPKQFSYEEIKEATNRFSDTNFLAEGGFGMVYRGVLRNGQVVAVKRLKFYGPRGDADFCREVRLLSCAQHRNVVLLIGYCIDAKKRVLVYEYICNASLDCHLHVNKGTVLDWNARFKIAIGAARGLRYLHEDCRVGCIVHRDFRPSNILLTHDFEPLVADFGLASLYSEWDMRNEEQLIGTTGYLAPEYFSTGCITNKVDVYAFGIVLLELITGQRIKDLYYKDEYSLSDWFHLVNASESSPKSYANHPILDRLLISESCPDFPRQLKAMGCAASMCLHQDPDCRPSMSKVLRMLEGGDSAIALRLDLNGTGNRSGHMCGLSSRTQPETRTLKHSRTLSH
uniref:non-specific serine/threonine protein kinase n=1 Tax=Kalanchoe fedtschenkoi TaxID=63787 RepID=A0A7N0TPA4_KALFE